MAVKVSLEALRVFEGCAGGETCKIEKLFLSETSVSSCKATPYHNLEGHIVSRCAICNEFKLSR